VSDEISVNWQGAKSPLIDRKSLIHHALPALPVSGEISVNWH
jgi:hypothetical protein